MHRPPPPDSPRLEALLDKRDQLRIRINLALEDLPSDEARLALLRQRLADVESMIRTYE